MVNIRILVLFLVGVTSFTNSKGIFDVRLVSLNSKVAGNIKLLLCLKQYQMPLLEDGKCLLGKKEMTVEGSTFVVGSLKELETSPTKISFPFEHQWLGSHSLIVQLFQITKDGQESLLWTHSSTHLNSSSATSWQYEQANNHQTSLKLQWKLSCAATFYGPRCDTYCNDKATYGNFVCAPDGTKHCKEGWRGEYCDEGICKDGCVRGRCVGPETCQCFAGFEGSRCQECKVLPGCVNGFCEKGNECKCIKGWSGVLCSVDSQFCATNKPCLNGGVCQNVVEGDFRCHCRVGFRGKDCGEKAPSCADLVCLNGGRCQDIPVNGFTKPTCKCPQSFIGTWCQVSIKKSESTEGEWHEEKLVSPGCGCSNGGICFENSCRCPNGFTGPWCEVRVYGGKKPDYAIEAAIGGAMMVVGGFLVWVKLKQNHQNNRIPLEGGDPHSKIHSKEIEELEFGKKLLKEATYEYLPKG